MNRIRFTYLEYIAPLGSVLNKSKNGIVAMYRGFKIYENDDLKYGADT